MKKLLIYLLFIINFLVLILTWVHFSGNLLQTSSLGNSLIAMGRLTGLIAANLILIQLILIGRVKWVERQFGLDHLSKIHRLSGYVILGLIVLHPVLLTQGYAILNDTTYFSQYSDFLKSWEDLFQAFLGYLLLLGTIVLSITIIKKRLKYEVWYSVHLLNYMAIALVFGHQLKFGADSQSTAFQIYWYGLYVFAFGHLLWYRFLKPLVNFVKFKFVVSAVKTENNVTTITITGEGLDKLPIDAGQFFIFRFLQKKFFWQAHPFSLSENPDEKSLVLSAKHLGDYTSTLPNIQVGTKVILDGPHGIFTAKRIKKDRVLFIAGGIGITPIKATLEKLADSGKTLDLIYCNKTKSDIIFLQELTNLQGQNPNVKITHFLSDENIPGFETGYLTKDTLAKHLPNISEYEVFLCGPPGMMKIVETSLLQLSVPKHNIYFEKFSL